MSAGRLPRAHAVVFIVVRLDRLKVSFATSFLPRVLTEGATVVAIVSTNVPRRSVTGGLRSVGGLSIAGALLSVLKIELRAVMVVILPAGVVAGAATVFTTLAVVVLSRGHFVESSEWRLPRPDSARGLGPEGPSRPAPALPTPMPKAPGNPN